MVFEQIISAINVIAGAWSVISDDESFIIACSELFVDSIYTKTQKCQRYKDESLHMGIFHEDDWQERKTSVDFDSSSDSHCPLQFYSTIS